ncbi:MAG: carbohydrate ABC transporter permease [Vampirovibrionales bacterium]|nr:carbohydrate ABC transporter permease [Vampirovibrionales bacterium]
MTAKRVRGKKALLTALHTVILLILAALAIGPFLWLLSTALRSGDETIFGAVSLLPKRPTLENFAEVWRRADMGAFLINSLVISALTVVMNLTLSVLCAYPLARMRFAGRSMVFAAVLATMMIPFQVMMIPLYLLTLKLGLSDSAPLWPGLSDHRLQTWLGLSAPFAISGFGIFFVRQALASLPRDLEESAALDGCNSWQTLRLVLLPMIRPALATLAVFCFMASWGEFLWPSILVSKQASFTLPVGLAYLQGAFSANWRLIAAGAVLSMLPVLGLFALTQRAFVSGANAGAVKG